MKKIALHSHVPIPEPVPTVFSDGITKELPLFQDLKPECTLLLGSEVGALTPVSMNFAYKGAFSGSYKTKTKKGGGCFMMYISAVFSVLISETLMQTNLLWKSLAQSVGLSLFIKHLLTH